LNPNLKTSISPNIPYFWTSVYVFFFSIFINFYYTGIYNYVTGSDDLNSIFHVEMNIRNSKIATRMPYENNIMQLHNKNVSYYSCLRLVSVTH
jgi:hypothetical protein